MRQRQQYCPYCKEASLEQVELHNQPLERCQRCNGLWFDDNELSQAISHSSGLTDDYCVKQGFGEKLNQHLYHCHRCQQNMQQYHLLKDYQLTLDSCSQCKGIWVDGDEVDKVLVTPKLQDALSRLNQKVCAKSWLFQFFTQMPKEYNIKPHRTPYMTWSLLALNILIFIIYGFDDHATEYAFSYFAIDSVALANGQLWWSFISYQFLHGGVLHLVGNMYFLWIIGDNLEDVLGPWRFLLIYLACGVLAAIAELLACYMINRDLLMVGASGAVAGLFGMYLLWFRHASLTFMFIVWQKKLNPAWYFAIWAGLNILGLVSEDLSVAYWAHLGGLLAGLAVGLVFKQQVLAQHPLLKMLQQPEARIQR